MRLFTGFERRLGIPEGSIVNVIVSNKGKTTDYWGQLERGQLTVCEFEGKFSSLLSEKVSTRDLFTE